MDDLLDFAFQQFDEQTKLVDVAIATVIAPKHGQTGLPVSADSAEHRELLADIGVIQPRA